MLGGRQLRGSRRVGLRSDGKQHLGAELGLYPALSHSHDGVGEAGRQHRGEQTDTRILETTPLSFSVVWMIPFSDSRSHITDLCCYLGFIFVL
jgi:hypothetical protein